MWRDDFQMSEYNFWAYYDACYVVQVYDIVFEADVTAYSRAVARGIVFC